MMLKGRRVGTLSTGIILVALGLLFIGRTIFPDLDYMFIMSLWPLVFVFIGIEIIVSYIINKEEKIRYDAGSIALVFILSIFAMIMGWLEFAMEHFNDFHF